MNEVEEKDRLVQVEETGKCTVCGEAVVLARAAFLGHDNNFRPQELSRPGDKSTAGIVRGRSRMNVRFAVHTAKAIVTQSNFASTPVPA